MTAAV
jgi:hypothetical protein